MPIATPQGTLDFKSVDKVTFVGASSNTVIDTTTGSLGVGVGVGGPTSNLHVVGDALITGNVTADYFVGDGSNITGISSTLQAITDSGPGANVTSNTVQFSNATTGFVTTANVEVGGELTVSGKVTRAYNPGEIIEELNTVCNGRPVTVQSGTYTPTNVTSSQTSSSTHTEVNGSNITYNKPAGAKRIYYKFACHWEDAGNGALTNFKIQVYHNGGWKDINLSRYLHSAQYVNDGNNHGSMWVINEFVFECDADTESQHDGRFTSSKTSYTFRVTWRHHGNGYNSILHHNDWWDGATTNILHTPQLTIRSIA
jgi:hypothetical protein